MCFLRFNLGGSWVTVPILGRLVSAMCSLQDPARVGLLSRFGLLGGLDNVLQNSASNTTNDIDQSLANNEEKNAALPTYVLYARSSMLKDAVAWVR